MLISNDIYCKDCRYGEDTGYRYTAMCKNKKIATTNRGHSGYVLEYKRCRDINLYNNCLRFEPAITKRLIDFIQGIFK